MDAELGIQSEVAGIFAQQPRADAVEGAAPMQRGPDSARGGPHHLARDAFDAAAHLARGAAREGHQKDAARIGTVNDQVGNAMGKRVGLARTGSSDDQKWAPALAVADAVLDRPALLGVKTVEVVDLCEHGESRMRVDRDSEPYSRFVHKA